MEHLHVDWVKWIVDNLEFGCQRPQNKHSCPSIYRFGYLHISPSVCLTHWRRPYEQKPSTHTQKRETQLLLSIPVTSHKAEVRLQFVQRVAAWCSMNSQLFYAARQRAGLSQSLTLNTQEHCSKMTSGSPKNITSFNKRKSNQNTQVSVLAALSMHQLNGYLCFIFVRLSGLLLRVQITATLRPTQKDFPKKHFRFVVCCHGSQIEGPEL